jgi:transposase InsO family protein
MCKVLKVSRSGYYKHLKRKEKNTKSILLSKIEGIYDSSYKSYGYRRIYHSLKQSGEKCYKNGVYKLMKDNNLQARGRRKYRVTTKSDHKLQRAGNILDRQFNVHLPNRAWVSDITYVWTREGWLYLSIIMDISSRKIVSYDVSKVMSKEIVTRPLHRAIKERKPSGGLIFHSDQGSQYASKEVSNILKSCGFNQSMSRRGNCWDNAVAESFFKTLKTELLNYEQLQTRQEAEMKIFKYIEGFYNTRRLHSSIGYLSPNNYEKRIIY